MRACQDPTQMITTVMVNKRSAPAIRLDSIHKSAKLILHTFVKVKRGEPHAFHHLIN